MAGTRRETGDGTAAVGRVSVDGPVPAGGRRSTTRRTGVTATPTPDEVVGVIHPDELYTLTAFRRRLGMQAAALRSARRAGLRVYYVHKHGFVLGRDWIEYVLKAPVRRDGEPAPDAPGAGRPIPVRERPDAGPG